MSFRVFFFLSLISGITTAYGQAAHDIMIGAQIDLVKTDYLQVFDKTQFGFEMNYFASKRITATAGLEVWTADEFSFVIGARWFPTDDAFLRVRGLVGGNDLSLGAGWTKPVTDHFRFEAIGDFYFRIDFAIRAGIVYIIHRN